MKKLAAGIIVGLFLGVVIGYQFASRTDTSELDGTIELLLEELDSKNKVLESSRMLIETLENDIDDLESELEQAEDEVVFLYEQLNVTHISSPSIDPIILNFTEYAPSVIYQLQNYDLDELESAGASLYIIDYSKEGDEESRFTQHEVQRLQNMTLGGKVLSYISIGEAEDYRYYWKNDWDEGDPDWLGATNPEWEGNYKVKYWDPEWQSIVFGYIDKIMESGFNGIYLDIIDAYEYWGPDGDSGRDRETAKQDMVDFVIAISEYGKAKDPDFKIYPQNGEALGVYPEYLAAIDGIGREDVWYNDDELQSDTNATLSYLDLFREAEKQVVVIDYPTEEAFILDFCERAKARGYLPYPGGRELNDIRICPE